MWDSIITVNYEPEKAKPLQHRLSLTVMLALWACPALAEFPTLSFPTPATQIGRRADAPADYTFPVAAFDGTAVPSRIVTGALDQRAYRLDGWRQNTLALLGPLRAQLESAGYKVIFDCETTGCGGFDFRFGMSVLPEPQMHVDLGDFRYLVAESASGDMVSLLVSRALDQGYVQVTSITEGPVVVAAGPGVAPVVPDAAPAIATPAPDIVAAAPQPQQPASQPGSLAAQIDRTGSAPLDDLVFASGKAVLEEGDYASLKELADWLKAHPDQRVTLVGHTDASGSLAGNIALSRQRAQAVRDWLIGRLAVDKAQVDAQGAGPSCAARHQPDTRGAAEKPKGRSDAHLDPGKLMAR